MTTRRRYTWSEGAFFLVYRNGPEVSPYVGTKAREGQAIFSLVSYNKTKLTMIDSVNNT